MNEYLKVFENHTQYETFTGTTEFVLPNVSYCIQEKEVHYNPYNEPQHDYSQDYLTIVSKADNNTIGWKATKSDKLISVSTDDGQTWTNQWSNTNGTTLATLNNGDKLLIKGSNTTYGSSGDWNYFTSTQNFDVEGNIMSLLYGDNFIGQTSLSGKNYVFYGLFRSNNYVVNAQNLILPATILASDCYLCMFQGCTSLTTIPELPATTLTNECYERMFNGCTSLTTAPELPATTLASRCYSYMFGGCTSLTTAPALHATTLASNCYQYMFNDCTGLTTAPTLPATTLAYGCYGSMFNGCTSLTTAPTLSVTTLADYCYSNMFNGCTGLTTAPEILPSTTLASYCYYDMFGGCTSLTTAPELPATTLASKCYSNMFSGCTSLTTAPALPATTLADYCYERMFNGCTSLTTAPELPATTLASNCYEYMFAKCTNLTTAPALPATTLAEGCYGYMFYGCASLTTAPELPATTLANNCYRNMFSGCTSLNYIKCLATDISVTTPTFNWVLNVAATGTFVKAGSMSSWTTGNSGIPSGWTVEDYHDYSNDYLTIVSKVDNNTIGWKASNSSNLKTISVSTDNGQTWTDKKSSTSTSGTTLATLNNGDKLLIKGNNTAYGTSSNYNYFTSTQNFDVEGNIMSLRYGDNFIGETSLSGKTYAFKNLFNNNGYLVNARNLKLPATTLSGYCYCEMFSGCTSLTTAPALPATTLAQSCYGNMFQRCTSLTTAPALPATTLANGCYAVMFSGCTSLTTAPELPATTLAQSCYSSMFRGCRSLTSAPELPATTLAPYCYQYMFYGCTHLNYIKCLAIDISATNCTYNWVYNVAATGTFVKNPSMSWWTTGVDSIPNGWTVQDA